MSQAIARMRERHKAGDDMRRAKSLAAVIAWRDDVQRRKAELELREQEAAKLAKAACRIQAVLRGKMARRTKLKRAEWAKRGCVHPPVGVDELWTVLTVGAGYQTSLPVTDFIEALIDAQRSAVLPGLTERSLKMKLNLEPLRVESHPMHLDEADLAHLSYIVLTDPDCQASNQQIVDIISAHRLVRGTEWSWPTSLVERREAVNKIVIGSPGEFRLATFRTIVRLITVFLHVEESIFLSHTFWMQTGIFELDPCIYGLLEHVSVGGSAAVQQHQRSVEADISLSSPGHSRTLRASACENTDMDEELRSPQARRKMMRAKTMPPGRWNENAASEQSKDATSEEPQRLDAVSKQNRPTSKHRAASYIGGADADEAVFRGKQSRQRSKARRSDIAPSKTAPTDAENSTAEMQLRNSIPSNSGGKVLQDVAAAAVQIHAKKSRRGITRSKTCNLDGLPSGALETQNWRPLTKAKSVDVLVDRTEAEATMIQAFLRSRKARRTALAKELVEDGGSTTEKRRGSTSEEIYAIPLLGREKVAVRIQAAWRGRQVRRGNETQLKEQDPVAEVGTISAEAAAEGAAVTELQAMFRSHLSSVAAQRSAARRSATVAPARDVASDEVKEEEVAATRIQVILPGRQARRFAGRRKTDSVLLKGQRGSSVKVAGVAATAAASQINAELEATPARIQATIRGEQARQQWRKARLGIAAGISQAIAGSHALTAAAASAAAAQVAWQAAGTGHSSQALEHVAARLYSDAHQEAATVIQSWTRALRTRNTFLELAHKRWSTGGGLAWQADSDSDADVAIADVSHQHGGRVDESRFFMIGDVERLLWKGKVNQHVNFNKVVVRILCLKTMREMKDSLHKRGMKRGRLLMKKSCLWSFDKPGNPWVRGRTELSVLLEAMYGNVRQQLYYASPLEMCVQIICEAAGEQSSLRANMVRKSCF